LLWVTDPRSHVWSLGHYRNKPAIPFGIAGHGA